MFTFARNEIVSSSQFDKYKQLKTLSEMAEQKEMYETIQERKNTPNSEYVSYDDAMKTAGL